MIYLVLASVGLVALAVILIAYALLFNSISNDKKSSQRIKNLKVDSGTKVQRERKKTDEKQRRKTRENTIKNIEDQRASGKKAASANLKDRIAQAGMEVSMPAFYVRSVIFFVVVTALALVFSGASGLISIGFGIVAGFGLPVWFVNFKRKRRFAAFTKIFPNAIDVIVRGIRSGLPLNDCLRIIAADAEEPVRSEFRLMIEATQMGIPVPEACQRLYERVPTSEVNFFAIVIAIQSSAGGNLSEALSNLSKVLRERKKLADKVTAFSTEAKTSAIIIGSLPFVVACLVHLSTPEYLIPLFVTDTGKTIMMVCAALMAFGIFVMKKMINFKF